MNENEKQTAAHALNLCTVSISQIIDYKDINVLKQEYDNIINNFNLENMEKHEALLDIIKEILDEITHLLIDAGDQRIVEREYQHKMKNAIWSAVPALGGVFASGNPVAIGLSLATQIGIGFMNYRRNVAEIQLNHEKAKWEISKNRLMHLNGLKKQLFETAWRLADTYDFPDAYRLTDKQISEYNKALMESNDTSRYLKLFYMEKDFQAYPPFWYQLGSTANRAFQSMGALTDEGMMYRAKAIECFEKYKELSKYSLLRCDPVASACAMEYFELLEFCHENDYEKAADLIRLAESSSGNALDILEICAFDYLRIGDQDNAARLFLHLVNEHYNEDVNTQVLSNLYIGQILGADAQKAYYAKIGYEQLKKIANPDYIIEIPDDSVDLSEWSVAWKGKEEDRREKKALEAEQAEYHRRFQFEQIKMKARNFYQKKLIVVYRKLDHKDVASYVLKRLDEYRKKIDPNNLPSPEMIDYKSFKKMEESLSLDNRSNHFILITGSSSDSKHKEWDYDEFGIKYSTIGSKTVLFTKGALKRDEKDKFISIERRMIKRYSLKDFSSLEDVVRMYIFGFYKYLESENAIVALTNTDEINSDETSDSEALSMRKLRASSKSAQKEAKRLMTREQLKKCHTIIHSTAVACAACGAIPIPVADAIPMTSAQIAMVIALGKVFGISVGDTAVKTIFSAVAAPLVGRVLAGVALKFIPVIGWTASAGIAFYVTEAIGWTIAVDFARQYRLSHQ